MGAGKTEVGSRLAALAGVEFADLDRVVEVESGMSIARIFSELGEEEFRRRESAALAALAADSTDLVIATGGGTPAREHNVEVMRSSGIIVWLDLSFEEILARLDAEARRHRPLFSSPERARSLFRRRQGDYAAADVRIEIDRGEGAEATAERVRRAVSEARARARFGAEGP